MRGLKWGFGFLVMVCAGAAQSAYADGSVSSLGMGRGASNDAEFRRYEAVVAEYNKSGERFRIDANCRSACTMFLGIRNVCVSPGATLEFHAGGSMGRIIPDKTRRMQARYNGKLRSFINANHYMDTFDFHAISGSDLINRFGYKACS